MVNPFEKFTINSISRTLNKINPEISLSHQRPFPGLNLLSSYKFKKRFVKIFPNGDIKGGMCTMITSLIDFSFVRSLVADCYSNKGPPCYDPPTLFLLDLFRYIDGYNDMNRFCEILRDEDQGRSYRQLAGLTTNTPCEATFSHFRCRLGASRYNEIFHVLVKIFHQLKMITFNILAHDGTLYPTWARYKGCTYFCDQCASIRVEDVLGKVRNRILYRLNNLANDNLGSEVRVYTECPSTRFPDDVNKPRIELFSFKLAFSDAELTEEQKNTATLFQVEDDLHKQGLCTQTLRSNVLGINPDDGSITIRCPKLPKDTDARIGVRRDPTYPDKKEKIFGYNLVLSTSVDLQLKLELPVAISNIAGNADEGSLLITNKEQISQHHPCQTLIDIADAKYDIIANYEYIRASGSIPIIDYNVRNEKLSKNNLIERGFDQNGWPFSPCGLLCQPNGFDKTHQRLTFCCFKQCAKLRQKAMDDLQSRYNASACPYAGNKTGFAKHMYVKEHPRLVNKIPRGSKRYREIKKIRSASERSNSTLKDDLRILEKPKVMNAQRANILAQMAGIVLILKRGLSFIIKVTHLLRMLPSSNNPAIKEKLKAPLIPKSIRNLIQLE